MARVILEDIDVLCVVSEDGPSGALEAFAALESALGTPSGRRFYGTCLSGEYRACVARQEGDDAEALGLAAWRIPGGAYERRRIVDWQEHVERIAELFDEMIDGVRHDASRPSIEYYRSSRELLLLQPVE